MTITQETEILVLQLMFGDYQERNFAYSALQRRGFDRNVLSKLNRKGEFQTGLILENFQYIQNNNFSQCPHCGGLRKQSYNKSVLRATANTIVADVKSLLNYAKAKALIFSINLGLPSKASDKIDTIGGEVNIKFTKKKLVQVGV